MAKAERENFLDEPRIALIAIPSDGAAPLHTPTWFLRESNGEIAFTCEGSSEKARRPAVGTSVALNVQDTAVRWGARYVTAEGVVTRIDREGGR